MGYKLLPKCDKCLYVSGKHSSIRTCDYILIVGHSRGCSIEDCEFYKHNVVENMYTRFQLAAKPKRETAYRHGKHLSLEDKTKIFYPFYMRKYNDKRIARATGWSVESVGNWRRSVDLPPIPHGVTREFLNTIKELYNEGLTDVEIAEKLGRTRKSIETYRLKMGLRRDGKKTEEDVT